MSIHLCFKLLHFERFGSRLELESFQACLMCYGQFPPKSSLKLKFVLLKTEEVSNAAGISNLCQVVTFSGLKRTNLNFNLLLGRN